MYKPSNGNENTTLNMCNILPGVYAVKLLKGTSYNNELLIINR